MLEFTLPPLLVMTTLVLLHRFHVLNRLSFIGLNRSRPLRELITAWRTHRTAEAVRATRTHPVADLDEPSYRGRHRHKGPVVIARGVEQPTVPLPVHVRSRHRPRRPFKLGARKLPRSLASTHNHVDRNPVRPAGRHSTAA
ncbi:hypothetical protein [Allokutzneria sp. NRRL B-24872]|uniref:hypothetical protein n=1 Tax=Allokutzneria sp. NRRL B-24872 TaxID=1137961 RepID=UPI000A3AE450|nr:hypothetical protein [Allokutzneria sp. NRRL B-24872]